MAWPDTSLVAEVKLELSADPSADPTTYTFATDITAKTFDRSGDSSIVIRRGRQDEMTQAQPSACELTVNNSDGRFSPRNPVGTYYPGLRRNTPIRVRVNPGTGLTTRYVGFVSEWPPRWDVTEKDHNVPVRADGILRRLGQGASPVKSAAYRAFTGTTTAVPPIAYWSLEDPAGSLAAITPTAGVSPGTIPVAGHATFGETGPGGTAGAALLVTGNTVVGPLYDNRPALRLPIPAVATGELVVAFWFQGQPFEESASAPTDGDIATVESWVNFSSGTIGSFLLRMTEVRPYLAASDSYVTGDAWTGVDTTGSEIGSELNTTSTGIRCFDGGWHHVQYRMEQSGGNVAVSLWLDGVQRSSQTLITQTLGQASEIKLGTAGNVSGATDQSPTAVFRASAVTVHNDTAVDGYGLYWIGQGYPGEISGTRFARLCTEENITDDVAAGSTEAMGPQGIKTPLDLLRECEAAEEGLIVERANGRLGFDPHSVRENQTTALTLNYASRHVSPPLEPTDDDQRIRNDVTVTRPGGPPAGSNAVDTTGPVGVTAVGRYHEGVELNLYTDAQAYEHAGWRVNLGTVDGLRFPTVTVNLRRNNSLTASFLALDIGSRIKITNLPDVVSYDDVDLIVEGYTEQISQKNWVITFNCAPYRPYKVFTLANTSADAGEFLGRLDWDSCVLAASITTVATSMTTTTTPLITTVADDFPLSVIVGGEQMTVTNCTGSANPQTLTVTRSVNGVVHAHTAGDAVTINEPMVLAL